MKVQPEGGLGLPRRKPPFTFSLSFFPFNDRTGSAGTQFIFSISALVSLGYCGCLQHMLNHPPFQFPADRLGTLLENLSQYGRALLLPVSVATYIVVL